ncbi:TPA: hypothetical protein HA243_06095 [Candidatus Micrarchaeota archaeon]|nr:hypothetical protein [Candidatus Micrarchaeota archaeon]
MAFPDNLRQLKIGDLNEKETDLLYGALEALGVDETLGSEKSLAFLADKYLEEKKKGALANQKAMQMIEGLSSNYNFCITHMAMSADSKYGVFVLEEHTDYTLDKGRHARWTAYKVSKEGISEVYRDKSHEKAKESGKISISHVADGGIVLAIKGGKKLTV